MPGYILVKMMYGDDIWHAVTRTQYITGFVGPKGRPICITDDEARKMGAMALFGEKYGDIVRVVEAKNVSVEFCGGTHIDNTARLGLFKILSENSVAAGVRRIEAVTGEGVLKLIEKYNNLLTSAAAALKIAKADDVPAKCAAAAAEIKTLEKEKAELNSKLAASQTGDIMSNAVKIGSVRAASVKVSGVPADALRKMGDEAKDKYSDAVIVFVSVNESAASILCVCGKDAVAAGANAGKIVKEIAAVTGGKGGGRPDSAMAGAGDVALVDKALDSVADIVKSFIQ